jgi:hypothetical protein
MAERRFEPLPCGTDLGALIAQVADGVPGDLAHQATCPWCQPTLAELNGIWEAAAHLAAERVEAPERIDEVVLRRIRRAIFVGEVTKLFGGLASRLGRALLTYAGLIAPQRGEAT